MDKNEMLTSLLIAARDAIEECIDELNPPPSEEAIESVTSEAPPLRGVAEPRRTVTLAKKPRRA